MFAPEQAIAAFGGDPDNFQFPRWCLDMSLLRAYEKGKPAATPSHLVFNWAGAKEKEPVFVAGHPGSTQRLLTVAQLKTERDLVLPFWLLRFSELRGRLIQYSKSSPEAARTAKDFLDSIENSIKVRRQQLFALLDDRLMDRKVADEQKLRAFVKADSDLNRSAGSAWDDIAKAQTTNRDVYIPWVWLEGGAAFNTDLFFLARQIVRAADERAKPNSERLREYTDARLPALRQALEAASPIYPEFEQVRLSFSLERMREWLGPDHPVVKSVLGASSPDERAKNLITGSKLADPKIRLALFDGGQKAVAASTDPMIQLARAIDADARSLRKTVETQVDGPHAARAASHLRSALQGVRDQSLSRRHVHAASHLRRRRRLDGARRAGRSIHAPGADVRAHDGSTAVRAAEALDRRKGVDRSQHPRELHRDDRHRRRQFGQPAGERLR